MKHITEFVPSVFMNSKRSVTIKGDTRMLSHRSIAALEMLEITHPRVEAAKELAIKWLQEKASGNRGISAVFCGGVGIGKTHIAKSLLWAEFYKVDDEPIVPCGYFFEANRIIQSLGQDCHLAQMIDPQHSIVVVDDVCSEQAIPFISAENQARELELRYYRLVNYCYENKISLIVTSNLTPEGLREYIGKRAWDRLSEMAPKEFMIDMSGAPSYRQIRSGREEVLVC